MELYLLRHGDYARVPGLKDADCPLSGEGRARMEREAAGAARLGVRPGLVLSSPLRRARETAGIMAAALGSEAAEDARLAPGFDARALADLVLEQGDRPALMLVGHAPDLAEAIGACTGARAEMRKGSLARIDLENPRTLAGVLAWLLPAEALAR
jgi:phosphohistidine phosphatase